MNAITPGPAGSPSSPPEHLLEQALATNAGSRDWRDWKAAAARDIMALARRAERLTLLELDLSGDFYLRYRIDMPVPRWPVRDELVVGNRAEFDLQYQEQWRWQSPPSLLPLAIRQPTDLYHPNGQPALLPPLPGLDLPPDLPFTRAVFCTGHLPPGTLPRELILLGYFAVSLQLRELDEFDPQGVLNPIACQFFRRHPRYLPLTRAGLFDPWPSSEGDSHDTCHQPADHPLGQH